MLTSITHFGYQPEGLEQSQIGDYFDMDFTTLPHKLLQPERFEEEILQLRARFVDRQNTFFKPVYHKRIPADGFAPYLSNIWVSVVLRLARTGKVRC